MARQKKLIVGNWKMNPQSFAEAKKLAGDVKKGVLGIKKTEVVLCSPYVYLPLLSTFRSQTVLIGSQDAFYEPLGSFTGEVSYSQLLDFKVSYVILGHSERRARGETDEMVNKKVFRVVGEGMTAIICIGENQRDHEGEYLAVIKNQLLTALKDVSKKSLDNVVIAYEPIWAVGAKYAMTPQDIHETVLFIRKVLKDAFDVFADDLRILYGGSVDAINAKEIVREGTVSGLLIGRASLKAKDFVQIVKEVEGI